MSAWWVVGIALLLLAEGLLAWHCWRKHRTTTRDQPIYCPGLNPITRTGYCRHHDCEACQHSREMGALLRAAHPEVFGERAERNGR